MATQVILLERVDNLGEMGDVVAVKPGYARNFLLPQKKALRASKDNIAYFEAKKKVLAADNDNKRKDAEGFAKKLDGLKVALIRQASESGQLFGSVSSRDIAKALSEEAKQDIIRAMVVVNQSFKTIGLFPVDIALHPEVKVSITVNIARTPEEAKIQADTGKALIADGRINDEPEAVVPTTPEEDEAAIDAQLEDVLEEGALEAEKEKQADAKVKDAEEEAKAQARAEAKIEADAAKAAAEAEAAEAAEAEGDAEATEETAEADKAE